jgi:hypothetical protein
MLAKLVYLLWSESAGEEARRALLEQAAPRLLEAGAAQLSMDIADPESRMRSPAPRLTRERPISAEVSLWTERPAEHEAFEGVFAGLGFRAAGYLVEEWLYTDYGDNSHAAKRSWGDGERSPGVMTVTLLERPRRLTVEEWLRRWHGVMSPVSEAVQPRAKYVRNLVLQRLTAEGPKLDAIVEESWPSKRHVANPFLFYRAGNPWQLVVNLTRLLHAVLSCFDLHRIRVTPTSEYLIKTDASIARTRRSSYDRYC